MLFKHEAAREQKVKAPAHTKPDFARAVRIEETEAEAALALVKSAFGLEGFGVLAEIDLRRTLEAKLDKSMAPLWVIDFCNPSLADRALAIDRQAALLMPCKVAVWQDGRDAVVAALRPAVTAAMMALDELEPVGRVAERHLERALFRLASPGREPGSASDDDLASPDDA
jgi:uncharacterized protein (DUF302 family)